MSKDNKKTVIFSSIILVLVTLSLLATILNYLYFLNNTLIAEESAYINELLAQSAKDIQDNILSEQNTVKNAGMFIQSDNHDFIMKSLNDISAQQQFQYMGFADKNGIGYTTNGERVDYSHDPFFTHSIQGVDYISDPFNSSDNATSINLFYSSPMYDASNNIIGVVFALSSDNLYTNVLNYSIMKDTGYVYLVSQTGGILATSDVLNQNSTDIMDIYPSDPATLQSVKNNIQVGVSGYKLVNTYPKNRYIFHAPIGDTSWSLVIDLPDSTISSRSDFIMMYTTCVCVTLFAIFIILMMFIIHLNKKSKRNLERLAYRDFVTNGRNYNKFKLDAEKILSKKNIGKYAVITLDINRFKYINDLYGYDEGTRILKCIYTTTQESIGPNELVGRMGNDKFVFLFHYTDASALQERIEALCLEISTNNSYNFVFAVGIYEITDTKLTIDAMIDRAMIALKSVKNGHQTAYAFYDEKIRNAIIRERSIENDMHNSLRDGEFEIYYQPKYFIDNSTLAGAEALVRWNHHEKGFMSPGEFIPLFEKSDFIIKLDHYVFENTCKNIRKWLDEGKEVVTISINFSRVHLNNPNCLDEYEKLIKKYNIPPKLLEFEFTESAIFENSSTLIKILEHIHRIGCSVSMDDFGTGYSSLNMLKEVPVDVLKLDKEFFSDSSDSTRGKDIVEAIVTLARKLNIHVVAEGVEEQEQLEFLHNIKCDVAQGYYFSKPIPMTEFEKLLLN